MNKLINPENHPAGSRFLYRNSSSNLEEGTIREWSASGQYLNLDGRWISYDDIQYLTIVETLPDDTLWQTK